MVKPTVLVIGNGFDLYHGLPTRYLDFIKNFDGKSSYFSYFKGIQKDLFWIDVEVEIENLHKIVGDFIGKHIPLVQLSLKESHEQTQNISLYFMKIPNGNEIRDFILFNMDLKEINENTFRQNEITATKISEFYENLITQYELFKEEFKEYLKNSVDSLEVNENISLTNYLCEVKDILTYNYTNTFKKLYANDREINTIHVHGNIEDNIVLGIPYMKSTSKFKTISKEVQVSKYNYTVLRDTWNSIFRSRYIQNRNSYLTPTPTVIAIMGHSLGETDWHTLKKIFVNQDKENRNDRITIFYHNDQSHSELVINFFEMVGLENGQRELESGRVKFMSYLELETLM